MLAENMVIRIEPGICIQGTGGFRHSDTVLVTKNGSRTMTNAQVDLNDLILNI